MAAGKVAAHRERGAYEISTTYTPLMWQHSGSYMKMAYGKRCSGRRMSITASANMPHTNSYEP